ncbi:MAG: CTP synthase [Planctomycetota bacterium]
MTVPAAPADSEAAGRKRKRKRPCKHIFVTGGVVSSLGKGIASASIGRLLRNMGFTVRIQKLDPYLNVDPGTMNPYQHGEVFVTDDGAETDLDLGHYERFLNQPCNHHSTYTSGRIYQTVIQKERAGAYQGGTVQVIPHVTNEIKLAITTLADPEVDVVITELGGTVGDIEGQPFLEAVRQFQNEAGRENVVLCHLAYIPYVRAAGEMKTKPAQHSAQKLRELGLIPDFLFCRSEHKLEKDLRDKLSLFCNVSSEHVIELPDAKTIYEVPLTMQRQKLEELLAKRLGLPTRECDMRDWKLMLQHIRKPKDAITVALVGKYIRLQDSYKSVTEAIDHAAWANRLTAEIVRVEGEDLERDEDWQERLAGVDCIVVPGGFGKRGFESKIMAARFARENGIPFLGLCLGMQAAAVEFARNVLGLEGAHSWEMDEKSPDPIVVLMEEQRDVAELGGTMRLGAYPCTLPRKTSRTSKAYGGREVVYERHRHRLEFNNDYRKDFEQAGMLFTGLFIPDPEEPERSLVEIIELRDHPFFVATQAHPEFKSSPVEPHPLFKALIATAYRQRAQAGGRTDAGEE